MVGSQRPPRFGNDIGVWNVILVSCIHHGRGGIIDVFLYTVVHAAFAVGGTGTVVINSQTPAYVYKFNLETGQVHLHIKLGRFTQGDLDPPDFVDLASDVEMEQTKAFFQSAFFKVVHRLQQLARSQPKFADIASRIFPFAAS